jgi:hypothetical protein
MAGHFEADADVDTDVSKAKPARKKSVSKAAGAGEKPKTPRKRAPKKQANSNADIEGDHNDSTEEGSGETTKPTPKKRGPKPKKVEVDGENGDADVEDGVELSTPKAIPVKKRTPKAKKESAGENGPSASSSSKKRASLGGDMGIDDGTPSKKPRATPSKAVASKLPTNRSELKDEDKLMLEMKKAGKTWAEITTAYSGITGLQYGKSTLAVRYAKIIDALTEWKNGDVSLFLAFLTLQDTNNCRLNACSSPRRWLRRRMLKRLLLSRRRSKVKLGPRSLREWSISAVMSILVVPLRKLILRRNGTAFLIAPPSRLSWLDSPQLVAEMAEMVRMPRARLVKLREWRV